MKSNLDVNNVVLIGRLEGPFKFAYCENEENIYSSAILVSRLSGKIDRIPVTINEKLLDGLSKKVLDGKIKVIGYIISFTRGGKLNFTVRIDKKIIPKEESEPDSNFVKLSGAICSKVRLRERNNNKTVCDFMFASITKTGEKSYIPTIAWNNWARFIQGLKNGNQLLCEARLQSRNFEIKVSDDVYEEREAYEVSINKIWKVK